MESSEGIIKCPNCSAPADEQTVYCDKCGYVVNNTSLDTYERTTEMYKWIGYISAVILVLYFIIYSLLPPI